MPERGTLNIKRKDKIRYNPNYPIETGYVQYKLVQKKFGKNLIK